MKQTIDESLKNKVKIKPINMKGREHPSSLFGSSLRVETPENLSAANQTMLRVKTT